MTKRFGQLPFITKAFSLFAIVAFTVLAIHVSPAIAAPADIAACDGLAAHPGDKDKPAGVKGSDDIAKADIAAALKACKLPPPC